MSTVLHILGALVLFLPLLILAIHEQRAWRSSTIEEDQ